MIVVAPPPRNITVRYIGVLCYTLIYNGNPQCGKLILLTSPRVCFCFAFQVTGFLFWLWLCADCLLSCSHQMFGVFLCVVYSITDLTRWVFDNIYVTKR